MVTIYKDLSISISELQIGQLHLIETAIRIRLKLHFPSLTREERSFLENLTAQINEAEHAYPRIEDQILCKQSKSAG